MTIELDGELYCHGMPFEEIRSRTGRTVNLHPDHEQIELHVFDLVTGDPQTLRSLQLSSLAVATFKRPVCQVNFAVAGSLSEIMAIYNQILAEGYEGIVVRNYLYPYERKRSTGMMKFKPKKSDWYAVIGVAEEIDIYGNPKNSLGALVCCGDDETEFNVGSGFTREQRVRLWQDRSSLPGLMCHVQYQHVTPGRGVPRFPVFVTLESPLGGTI
jgi:DNA ligase-1